MSGTILNHEARLLTAAERGAASLTLHPAIAGLARSDLQDLARRLRDASGQARTIAGQQRCEMHGKSVPRGAVTARELWPAPVPLAGSPDGVKSDPDVPSPKRPGGPPAAGPELP